MQINIQGTEQVEQTFFFQPQVNKILEDKELKEALLKWGLSESLKIGSFRYNQKLQQYDINRFLKDFFNNPNVRYILNNIKLSPNSVSTVQSKKIRCTELSLELFDQFEKEGITKKGYISKMFPQYFNQIQICDKIRQCLLMEESEHYYIFNQTQRSQLLFRLFQLLSIGGSFNQYQDVIQPYLDQTKKLYKSIVSVRKRTQTQQIFIQSQAYQIISIDEGKGYKKSQNVQDTIYVIINASIRSVHVLANTWQKHW